MEEEMFWLIKHKLFGRSMEYYDVNIEELKEKQVKGAIIVDVRSSQEYLEGHLKGAISIPYYEINKNVYNILKDKNKDIILYCQSGVRSKQAYKKLIKLQYKNVYNLYKGLDNWL